MDNWRIFHLPPLEVTMYLCRKFMRFFCFFWVNSQLEIIFMPFSFFSRGWHKLLTSLCLFLLYSLSKEYGKLLKTHLCLSEIMRCGIWYQWPSLRKHLWFYSSIARRWRFIDRNMYIERTYLWGLLCLRLQRKFVSSVPRALPNLSAVCITPSRAWLGWG